MTGSVAEERVRAALPEAGYRPQVHTDRDGIVRVTYNPDEVPRSVVWRAFAVVSPATTKCWPCWFLSSDGNDVDCDHDLMAQPWPPR